MKINTKKALSASTIASLLITSSVVSVNVKADTVTPPQSPRLWGADRYETAVKVSQAGWTSGSDYAILASGEGYADALCAAPLAKVNNAPILLTQKSELNQNTLNELKRLNVKHVVIIGGQGVVSQAVEDAIKSNVTSDIQRLWGQDRYETSVKVAQKLGVTSKIVLASGAGYADALSAAPVAAIEGMPILLTESNTLSKPTADYIKSNSGITKTYVIGGNASVSDATMSAIPSAQRLGGADRYETNASVINNFTGDFNFNNAYLALGDGPSGNEFADALSGAAIAAKNKNPLIITDKTLSSSTQKLIASKLTKNSTITILGGVANIPDELVTNIISILPAATVTGGGGGGGGIVSTATYINQAGTYTSPITGDAHITASNVTLTGSVSGNLYIDNGADMSLLSGITVGGTIYVNPGASGTAVLNNVTANNIVIQSGAPNSIDLNNVTANTLDVNSTSNVHVKSQGVTKIGSTKIESQVILEAAAGSFGTITIPQSTTSSTIELRGSFDRPIIVQGNANLVTNQSTNIPAIVIPEGVNALGIKLDGAGTIGAIQVRRTGAVLNIGNSITVTGKIQVLNKNSITSSNSAINSKIDVKNSTNDMDNLTAYTDITSSVAKVYTSKIASHIQNHPTLVNDVDVNTSGNPIVVTLKNTKLDSLSTVFTNVQNEDPSLIKARLTKIQNGMNSHSSLFNIDGLALNQYLAKAESNYVNNGGNANYFNADGSLNVDSITARISNKTLTYSIFKADLKSRVEAMCNVTKNAPKLSIGSTDFSETVTKIVKDGTIMYDTNLTREANIQGLINLGDTTTGTYTVYCGTDYFTVQVK